MVNVCCVPGCKTGYKCTKTSHQSSEAIPIFKFPVDPILKKKWIYAIPRQDWTVSPNHRVCVKHFTENDVIKTSTDQRKDRADARPTKNLQRLHLKPNVIPHIFQSISQSKILFLARSHQPLQQLEWKREIMTLSNKRNSCSKMNPFILMNIL